MSPSGSDLTRPPSFAYREKGGSYQQRMDDLVKQLENSGDATDAERESIRQAIIRLLDQRARERIRHYPRCGII